MGVDVVLDPRAVKNARQFTSLQNCVVKDRKQSYRLNWLKLFLLLPPLLLLGIGARVAPLRIRSEIPLFGVFSTVKCCSESKLIYYTVVIRTGSMSG